MAGMVVELASTAALKQQIRLCNARDGARIAVASVGKGPPLLRATHLLTHVEFDGRSPLGAHWVRELSRGRTYIRYDQRGCGLSDWSPPSLSFESWVSDLEVVVDTLGLQRFALFGMCQGGPLAIAYAARYPERVSHLILLGTYAQGRLQRPHTEQQRQEAELLVDLIRIGWARDNPAFRQLFTSLYIPGGTQEQHQWFNELARVSCPPENAAALIKIGYHIDVTTLAESVQTPTLIFHARGDAGVPFDEGRRLAALIPSARFVPLDSRNHMLLESEPAWTQFSTELHAFLADGVDAAAVTPGLTALTRSEHEVLGLLARGLDNAAIAVQLRKSQKTVRNQVSSILGKLHARSRAEAIVRARDAGIGEPPS
jgi:pimeloyl-ACP methyl ester carboxylesterase